MKKTLITLLALSGLAMSAELNFTGADHSWFEVKDSWTDAATGSTATSAPTTGDVLTISGKQAELGSNARTYRYNGISLTIKDKGSVHTQYGYTFTSSTIKLESESGMEIDGAANITSSTITIEGGASMTIGGTANITSSVITIKKDSDMTIGGKAVIGGTGSTITIEDGASMTLSGEDCKIGNGTVWNVYAEDGLTLGKKTWLDTNGAQSGLTFNLGKQGSVCFSGDIDYRTAFPGLTLNADFDVTIPAGSSVVTFDRELVTFTDYTFTTEQIAALNQHLHGAFIVNGITLTQGDLSEIGHYSLAMNEAGNAIVLSYSLPEPATATLSLLALAGLAARRKRK